MKFCPFCGSPAANWPEYATDYVRGYPLCEHHMSSVLEHATKYQYDEEKKIFEDRWNELAGLLSERLDSIVEDQVNPLGRRYRDHTSLSEGYYNHVVEVFTEAVLKCISESPIKKGPPIRVFIDDSEVDRLVSVRIKGFAYKSQNKKGLHRCSAFSLGQPDNRCTNRVFNSGDICSRCNANTTSRVGNAVDDKIEQIMGLIRS